MKNSTKALLLWYGGIALISILPVNFILKLVSLNTITGGLVVALIEKIKDEIGDSGGD